MPEMKWEDLFNVSLTEAEAQVIRLGLATIIGNMRLAEAKLGHSKWRVVQMARMESVIDKLNHLS